LKRLDSFSNDSASYIKEFKYLTQAYDKTWHDIDVILSSTLTSDASRETSRRVLQVVINQGWRGFSASLGGPSTCLKSARKLTFQPFVGIMGAD
jgi:hypothetical protein